MTLEHEADPRISAYVDGELSPEEARAFEVRLETEPVLAAEVEIYRSLGDVLRRDADRAEREVDFDHFYDGVAARLKARPVPQPGPVRRFAAAVARLLQRPALAAAAAAAFLFVVGAGSFYLVHAHRVQPVSFQGGPAVIEDLSVDEGGAVVYRTQSNTTVIWLTENKGT